MRNVCASIDEARCVIRSSLPTAPRAMFYGAVIMAFDECRTAPNSGRPSDQARGVRLCVQAVRLYRLSDSTATIDNQIISTS